MADINYYASINMIPNGNDILMNQNELQLPVIDNESTAPSAPVQGQMYFDTTAGDKTMYFYNGTAWVEMDGSGSGVVSLTPTNGTFIDITQNQTSGVITTTSDLSATGTPSATKFLRGDNVWATPSGSYTSWTLGATTGSDNEIEDGDDVDIVGTTGISTSIATAGVKSTLTINNTGVTSIVAGSNISVSAATGAVTISSTDNNDNYFVTGASFNTTTGVLSITGNNAAVGATVDLDGRYVTSSGVTSVATTHGGNAFTASIGNVATVNPSVNIAMAGSASQYINGAGNLTTFPAIPQGDLTGLIPGSYINIPNSTGPIPTINALGTTTSTPERLVARDVSGFGYVVTPSSGDSSEKIATTAFVQNATTGLLQLVGGFNASTGALASPLTGNLTSGAARVAVDVGDYYVVTVAGDFFGNAATPLTPGDSVIVQTQALTGTSVESDFIVVQSDTDLATASTVGLGNVAPGGAIDVSYSSGTATVSVEDSTASNKGAVIVDGDDPITVTYNSGTATVGIEDSAAAQKGAVIVSGGTGIDVAYASGTATVSLGAQSSLTFTNTGPATAGTSYPITAATHGLGSDSSIIMVQLVEVGSGETVYTDVVRGASGLITMTFAASQAINTFRALLQKIG